MPWQETNVKDSFIKLSHKITNGFWQMTLCSMLCRRHILVPVSKQQCSTYYVSTHLPKHTVSLPRKTETERQHLLLPALGCVSYDYYLTLLQLAFCLNLITLTFPTVKLCKLQHSQYEIWGFHSHSVEDVTLCWWDLPNIFKVSSA